MPKDAEEWVKSCEICITNGMPEKPTPMERIMAPKTVWETIALDFNGPYAKFGGIYILVLVDYRSRFIIASPVKSTNFEETRKFLCNVFEREGLPKNVKCDNGPPFNSDDFRNFCIERGIQNIYSTPHFPQQNGLVESYMKLINKAMASAVSSGSRYEDELSSAVKAHNAAAHSITKVAPEEMMYGRKFRRGLPLMNRGTVTLNDDEITKRDREAKLKGKSYEDRRRGARKCQIIPGDVVIVERNVRSKGDSRFDPKRYTVVQQKNGNLLLSSADGQQLRRHVTQTKRVKNDAPRVRQPPVEQVNKHTEEHQRPVREKKIPSYLKQYVRVVEEEKLYLNQQ